MVPEIFVFVHHKRTIFISC